MCRPPVLEALNPPVLDDWSPSAVGPFALDGAASLVVERAHQNWITEPVVGGVEGVEGETASAGLPDGLPAGLHTCW